jgi:hypothetical protein
MIRQVDPAKAQASTGAFQQILDLHITRVNIRIDQEVQEDAQQKEAARQVVGQFATASTSSLGTDDDFKDTWLVPDGGGGGGGEEEGDWEGFGIIGGRMAVAAAGHHLSAHVHERCDHRFCCFPAQPPTHHRAAGWLGFPVV